MLKKKDLAKQFELVVQQEIKNHNDSIAYSNNSLEEFRQKIKAQSDLSDKSFTLLASKIKQQEIEIENLRKSLSDVSQLLNSHINDMRVVFERNAKHYEEVVSGVEIACRKHVNVAEDIQILRSDQSKMNQLLKQLSLGINDEFDNISRNFLAEMKKMKQEILNYPSDIHLVKKELEKKMAEKDVDVAGILQEIDHAKRSTYVAEKKIENIYTLIDRMNKKAPE